MGQHFRVSGSRGGKTLAGAFERLRDAGVPANEAHVLIYGRDVFRSEGPVLVWRDETLTDLLWRMLLLEAEAHFGAIQRQFDEFFPDGQKPGPSWVGLSRVEYDKQWDSRIIFDMLTQELAEPYGFADNWQRVIHRWEGKHGQGPDHGVDRPGGRPAQPDPGPDGLHRDR